MFTEPVKLVGEGKYNLDAVKEITVTESYLGMDMDTRKCQNEEPMENCITRNFIESVFQQCGCLPLSIATSNNVITFKFQYFVIYYFDILLFTQYV